MRTRLNFYPWLDTPTFYFVVPCFQLWKTCPIDFLSKRPQCLDWIGKLLIDELEVKLLIKWWKEEEKNKLSKMIKSRKKVLLFGGRWLHLLFDDWCNEYAYTFVPLTVIWLARVSHKYRLRWRYDDAYLYAYRINLLHTTTMSTITTTR